VKEVYVVSASWAGSLFNEFYNIHVIWFENIMSEKNLGDRVTNAAELFRRMDEAQSLFTLLYHIL